MLHRLHKIKSNLTNFGENIILKVLENIAFRVFFLCFNLIKYAHQNVF